MIVKAHFRHNTHNICSLSRVGACPLWKIKRIKKVTLVQIAYKLFIKSACTFQHSRRNTLEVDLDDKNILTENRNERHI